jgi:hypothetical protein
MRLAKIGALTIAAAFWSTVVVADQGHGHAPVPTRVTTTGAPTTHSTSTHPTSHGPATKPATTSKPATTTKSTSHGPSTHGSSHKSTTATPSHEVEHEGAKHASPHAETEDHDAQHTSTPLAKSPRTTPPGPTTGSPTTSPIATKIKSHPQLAAKVTGMLPAGMTMDQAAMGFRNQGQFLAALTASRRLNIPFADLKTAMVTNHQSLGQAIHTLKPDTSSGGFPTTTSTDPKVPSNGTPPTPKTPKHGQDNH